MNLHELVSYLEQHGIVVSSAGKSLSINGPEEYLTDAVLDALKKHALAVVAHFQWRSENTIVAQPELHLAPQSFAQRRLYFLQKYDSTAIHFNLSQELELRGGLDVLALRKAIQIVVARHKILNTTYLMRDAEPWQHYHPEGNIDIGWADLTDLGPDQQQTELCQRRASVLDRPFNLEDDLPVRLCLVRLAPERHVLLLAIHHIATDGWSTPLLLREISEAYAELASGKVPAPRAPGVSYLDYALWQQKRHLAHGYEVAKSFWLAELEGISGILELPLDRLRPARQTFKGDQIRQPIPAQIAAAVREFAGAQQISTYSTYLACYFLLLAKLSGSRDLVVGTDVHGREHFQLKNLPGFFVNQLALRARIDLQLPFAKFALGVHKRLMQALDYQDMPFDRVVDALGIERDGVLPPVFQVKFQYLPEMDKAFELGGIETHVVNRAEIQAQYDLNLCIQGNEVLVQYNTDLYDQSSVQEWVALYLSLLESLIADSAIAQGAAMHPVLAASVGAATKGPVKIVPPLLHKLFTNEEWTHECAVAGNAGSLSYGALHALSTKLSLQLAALGCRRGDRVAIYLERSADMVAAILAASRIGAVFVPIDPAAPEEHTAYILEDSAAAFVITDAELGAGLYDFAGYIIDVDAVRLIDGIDLQLDPYAVASRDPFYLLYTSGSTGRPKGVVVTAGSFENLCDWYIDFAQIDRSSKVLLMIPVGFDAAIKNVFAPLMCGAKLVLAPSGHFDPAALLAQIRRESVTVINTVPSALYSLAAAAAAQDFSDLASVELMAVGGEALDLVPLRSWMSSPRCRARLANIYGPTECTDISVAKAGSAQEWLASPQPVIGKPIQNVQVFLVDRDLSLCPRGAIGELLIAGHGVAAGYHGDKSLTASKFVETDLAPGTAYRTGDLCRLGRDGNLSFVGRNDHQIKIRGKRVEPGEIIHALSELVPDTVISIQLYTGQGQARLLAFIAGAEAAPPASELGRALARKLPRHMVPSNFVFLDSMPLNANGKTCGKSLLQRFEASLASQAAEPLEMSALEREVAAIWESLLGEQHIDAGTNFFAIGGDSIFSIQLVAELKKRNYPVTVADVFRLPTVAELASHLAALRDSDVTPGQRTTLPPFALVAEADKQKLPAGIEDAYPLTLLQQGMVVHNLVSRASSMYHDVISIDITFDYDRAMFEDALQKMLSLHPVLRTRFDLTRYSQPLQFVCPSAPEQIWYQDISDLSEDRQDAHVLDTIARIKREGLDVEHGMLHRFGVLQKASNRIQLIIDSHHALVDGWSMATLYRQLFEYYLHLRHGRPLSDVFDTGGLRYADYVAAQLNEQQNIDSRTFWKQYAEQLDGEGEIGLLPEPGDGSTAVTMLDQELVSQLQALSAEYGYPAKTLFAIAHACMLRELTGNDRVLGAFTDQGRLEEAGGTNLIGLFLNVLPLHFDFRGASWEDLADAVRRMDTERKPHRSYPYARIIEDNPALACDALFTFLNFHVVDEIKSASDVVVRFDEHFEETNFSFGFMASGNYESGFRIRIKSKLQTAHTRADVLMPQFVATLRRMASNFSGSVPALAKEAPYELASCSDTSESHVFSWIRLPKHVDAHYIDELAMTVASAHASAVQQDACLERVTLAALLDGTIASEAALAAALRRHLLIMSGAISLLRYDDDEHHYLAIKFPGNTTGRQWARSFCTCLLRSVWSSGGPGARDSISVKTSWHGRWVGAGELQAQHAYWQSQLDGAPALQLPTVRPRHDARDAASMSVPVLVPASLAAQLRQLGDRYDTGLFTVLLAAWSAVIARLSGQHDVLVGMPMPDAAPGMLAVRVRFDFGTTVAQLISQVRGTVSEAHAHPDLPFHSIANTLQPPREQGAAPLQVMLTLAHHPDAESPALAVERPESGAEHVELHLQLNDTEGPLRGSLQLSSVLHDRAAGERIAANLCALLAAMATDPEGLVGALPLLDAEQRDRLLIDFNDTAREFPRNKLLHQLFEEQVLRDPLATALVCEGSSLSYDALNRKANRLAHRLIALGVRPDQRVAIHAERSLETVAGLLAILKAGGAYVPLDPAYPQERLAHMLADCAPVALLVQRQSDADAGLAIPVVALDGEEQMAWPDSNPSTPELGPRHLVYVLYTSGSTGRPKGVMVEHRSVVNLWGALACTAFDNVPARAQVAMNASLSFDGAMKSLLQLLSGHCLHIVPAQVRASGADLLDFLQTSRIDAFDCTPVQLEMLLAAGLGVGYTPRSVLVGGEAISRRTWERMTACADVRFHNVYGPTECTVDATIALASAGSVPHIGKPIANARIYLLDAHRQPVPLGVVGELYIGGAGVARGYLNRPELSAERFLDDPFAGAGERMYKTGDLARWLPDGNLEYIGRNDFQVKIRGFRIELGEIEARLAACPGVREAVVIAREDSPGEKRLVAYLIAADGAVPAPAELRAALAAALPDYMLPTAFVTLPAFPLTPNGKLDRNALPAPDREDAATRAYEAPQGEVEIAVAELWRELLGLERVGRNDRYFELGGHSLLLIRMLQGLMEKGYDVSAQMIYQSQTLSEFAALISERRQAVPHAGPGVPAAGEPLSPPDIYEEVVL